MSEAVAEIEHVDLDGALAWLAETVIEGKKTGRIEAACDAPTEAVIELYGVELDSKSKAIRDLVRRGAADLARERATRA